MMESHRYTEDGKESRNLLESSRIDKLKQMFYTITGCESLDLTSQSYSMLKRSITA
jgi:hypothetical protein